MISRLAVVKQRFRLSVQHVYPEEWILFAVDRASHPLFLRFESHARVTQGAYLFLAWNCFVTLRKELCAYTPREGRFRISLHVTSGYPFEVFRD